MTDDETAQKLAAVSAAMCDVLAAVTADLVVLRQILDAKKTVSGSEFDSALNLFRSTGKMQEYSDQIARLVREKAKAKINARRGPVN